MPLNPQQAQLIQDEISKIITDITKVLTTSGQDEGLAKFTIFGAFSNLQERALTAKQEEITEAIEEMIAPYQPRKVRASMRRSLSDFARWVSLSQENKVLLENMNLDFAMPDVQAVIKQMLDTFSIDTENLGFRHVVSSDTNLVSSLGQALSSLITVKDALNSEFAIFMPHLLTERFQQIAHEYKELFEQSRELGLQKGTLEEPSDVAFHHLSVYILKFLDLSKQPNKEKELIDVCKQIRKYCQESRKEKGQSQKDNLYLSFIELEYTLRIYLIVSNSPIFERDDWLLDGLQINICQMLQVISHKHPQYRGVIDINTLPDPVVSCYMIPFTITDTKVNRLSVQLKDNQILTTESITETIIPRILNTLKNNFINDNYSLYFDNLKLTIDRIKREDKFSIIKSLADGEPAYFNYMMNHDIWNLAGLQAEVDFHANKNRITDVLIAHVVKIKYAQFQFNQTKWPANVNRVEKYEAWLKSIYHTCQSATQKLDSLEKSTILNKEAMPYLEFIQRSIFDMSKYYLDKASHALHAQQNYEDAYQLAAHYFSLFNTLPANPKKELLESLFWRIKLTIEQAINDTEKKAAIEASDLEKSLNAVIVSSRKKLANSVLTFTSTENNKEETENQVTIMSSSPKISEEQFIFNEIAYALGEKQFQTAKDLIDAAKNELQLPKDLAHLELLLAENNLIHAIHLQKDLNLAKHLGPHKTPAISKDEIRIVKEVRAAFESAKESCVKAEAISSEINEAKDIVYDSAMTRKKTFEDYVTSFFHQYQYRRNVIIALRKGKNQPFTEEEKGALREFQAEVCNIIETQEKEAKQFVATIDIESKLNWYIKHFFQLLEKRGDLGVLYGDYPLAILSNAEPKDADFIVITKNKDEFISFLEKTFTQEKVVAINKPPLQETLPTKKVAETDKAADQYSVQLPDFKFDIKIETGKTRKQILSERADAPCFATSLCIFKQDKQFQVFDASKRGIRDAMHRIIDTNDFHGKIKRDPFLYLYYLHLMAKDFHTPTFFLKLTEENICSYINNLYAQSLKEGDHIKSEMEKFFLRGKALVSLELLFNAGVMQKFYPNLCLALGNPERESYFFNELRCYDEMWRIKAPVPSEDLFKLLNSMNNYTPSIATFQQTIFAQSAQKKLTKPDKKEVRKKQVIRRG